MKKKKSNAAYYEENWAERKERKEYYQSFTKGNLLCLFRFAKHIRQI